MVLTAGLSHVGRRARSGGRLRRCGAAVTASVRRICSPRPLAAAPLRENSDGPTTPRESTARRTSSLSHVMTRPTHSPAAARGFRAWLPGRLATPSSSAGATVTSVCSSSNLASGDAAAMTPGNVLKRTNPALHLARAGVCACPIENCGARSPYADAVRTPPPGAAACRWASRIARGVALRRARRAAEATA